MGKWLIYPSKILYVYGNTRLITQSHNRVIITVSQEANLSSFTSRSILYVTVTIPKLSTKFVTLTLRLSVSLVITNCHVDYLPQRSSVTLTPCPYDYLGSKYFHSEYMSLISILFLFGLSDLLKEQSPFTTTLL